MHDARLDHPEAETRGEEIPERLRLGVRLRLRLRLRLQSSTNLTLALSTTPTVCDSVSLVLVPATISGRASLSLFPSLSLSHCATNP